MNWNLPGIELEPPIPPRAKVRPDGGFEIILHQETIDNVVSAIPWVIITLDDAYKAFEGVGTNVDISETDDGQRIYTLRMTEEDRRLTPGLWNLWWRPPAAFTKITLEIPETPWSRLRSTLTLTPVHP